MKKSTNTDTYNYYSYFPTILRELLMNTTQEKLATYCNVQRQSIAQWKDGKTKPDIVSLKKIAEFFNVSTDYLLGLTEYPTTDKDEAFICEYTGLSEEAIRSITEDWKDIPEEWQESKVVLNAFMESINLFDILSYIFDYKEEYLRKFDLDKQAEQVFENACELCQKQEDKEWEETIIPRKEKIKFLRDSGYFDIQEKCDVYLFRAQRLFSKFVEDYATEGCDEWQTYKSEEIKKAN